MKEQFKQINQNIISSSVLPEEIEIKYGTVILTVKDRCKVESADGILDCTVHKDLADSPHIRLAVGDQVRFLSDSCGTNIVREILPRRSSLTRPDPHTPHWQQVIAANMDIAVIVVSVVEPPLRHRLIDRFLAALWQERIEPVLCINKMDLLENVKPAKKRKELDKLIPYQDLGIKLIYVSTETGEGIDSLITLLTGKTCVFTGHSGVGKSSILNAIDPELVLKVNSTRKGDKKGRHTTTAALLHRLPNNITIIDTPGIRELGIINVGGLESSFPEMVKFASGCKFSDCTHIKEPSCRVKTAVRDGEISRSRYESYCKMMGKSPGEIQGEEPFKKRRQKKEDLPISAERFAGDTSGKYLEPLPPHTKEEQQLGGFTCAHCGGTVPLEGGGTRNRNHCPRCLWSLHLDHKPGDRASCCDGKMEPVSVWVRKGGEWAVIHRCNECGHLSSNRIASDDNEMLLLSLAVRPLSKPPFSLERM